MNAATRRAARALILLGCGIVFAAPASAATIVVTDAGDPGNGVCDSVCTLREAITAANATIVPDTINFAIPTPVKTEIVIALASALPTITKPLTINGYSQTFTSVNTLASGSNAKLRIRIDGSNVPSGFNGLAVCSGAVNIKGLSITNFLGNGIAFGRPTTSTLCADPIATGTATGNFLGLRTDGTTPGANFDGLVIVNAIVDAGGGQVDKRNVISGNSGTGIRVTNAASSGTTIEGNLIGTDRSGTLDRGNGGTGIVVEGQVSDVDIGDESPNVVAYNNRGVSLTGSTAQGVSWYVNDFFANTELGIDLGPSGVTPNDAGGGDSDGGPNGLQNFPELTAANRVAGGFSVAGKLEVSDPPAAPRNYRLAFYASAGCDESGNGEGERYLGVVTRSFSTASEGFTVASLVTSDALPPGTVITATATDPNGSSSEFSACFALDPPPLVVNTVADIDDGACNGASCTLREAINAANARAGADVISFAIGSGLKVISTLSPLPAITDTVLIDGYTQPGASANTLDVGDDAVIGIQLDGLNAGASTSGLGICAPDTIVRGLAVTRFKQTGIRVSKTTTGADCTSGDPTPGGVVIAGNFVGLAPDGSAAGNLVNGIDLKFGEGSVVGGAAAADRNVISANGGAGGIVVSEARNDRKIANNYIGTDPAGTGARGNVGAGVQLSTNTERVAVGELARNRIAFNQTGIRVASNAGTRNKLGRNVIFGNAGLGIDLAQSGVTPNDADDADIGGGNDSQNFPVLTLAQRTAGGIRIEGSLDVTVDTIFNQFDFAIYANASCDPSGHGEGERYLGTVTYKLGQPPGASESFSFDLATDDPLPDGTQIAATATDPFGNTSELSACIEASAPSNTLVVTSTADTGGTTCGANCTLRQAINAANLQIGDNEIRFAIPTGPYVIAPATPLPTITDPAVIDGYSQLGASANTLLDGDDAVIQIRLDGAAIAAPAFGLGVCTSQTAIIGLSITGFTGAGIGIGFDASGVACGSTLFELDVQGNFIGLAPDGTAAGNEQAGVLVRDGAAVQIGGEGPATRNLISGNGNAGVAVNGAGAVRGIDNNYIGIGPDGEARGNLFGVLLAAQCAGVKLGKNAPNRIAFNGIGLEVAGSAGTGNTFDANEFFGNDGLGIDLGGNGVSQNDVDDADGGGNGGQNFPILESVKFDADGVTVKGSLDVPAATNDAAYRIRLYESQACDPSGHGEGEILLIDAVADLSGNAESFESLVKVKGIAPPAVGHFITATATDPAGNTSELSSCLAVTAPNTLFSDSYE